MKTFERSIRPDGWRHAGSQRHPHTSISIALLAVEQMIGNALIESCARDGRDNKVATRLREINAEIYELRLKELAL